MKLELDRRERVAMVCAFLALWMCFALVLFIPMKPQAKYRDSRMRLDEKKRELQMTTMMKAEEEERLRSQEKVMELLNKRAKDFDLLSFVNDRLKESNLTGQFVLENYRARQLSPKQPMVQLELKNISLAQLVDFLHKVYAGNNLVVMYKLERMHPASSSKGLDCEIIFATVRA